jgi:hypothetical protein
MENTLLYLFAMSHHTALHDGTTPVEKALENRDDTLGALLDIEGTFDITSLYIITKAVKRHGLGETICRWIGSMLGGKKIKSSLTGETLEASVARGVF